MEPLISVVIPVFEAEKYLLDNPQEKVKLELAAYNIIANEWNAEVAAERFANLARRILDGEKTWNYMKVVHVAKLK